jgi:ribose transport system substrate-binding protein
MIHRDGDIILRKFLITSFLCATAAVQTAWSTQAAASEKPTIVLSNAFLGNAWRRSMVSAFEEGAQKAQSEGLIHSFQAFNAPGENSAVEQIAQLKEILKTAPDILLVNPASPTALNATLQEACDMGVTVVVFDSSTDLECVSIVTNSFSDWARLSTQAVIDGIGGSGTVVLARGVEGSPPELEMYDVQMELLEAHPDIEVVTEYFTFCDDTKAQEVLLEAIDSLPEINGVVGCGEGLGAVLAFQAAGRDLPVVAFAPSGRALKFWAEGNGAPGSVAVMSDPGQVVAALYTAINIHNGMSVPRTTFFPPVFVADTQRDQWQAAVGEDEIASWQWTDELVVAQLTANINGTVAQAALPPVPVR